MRHLLPCVLFLISVIGCRNPDQQAARLLKEAESALARQQWDAAFAKAHEAAGVAGLSAPVQAQAREQEDRARAELQAQAQYARFVGALDTDHDNAVAAYRDLPKDSYYRGLGRDAFERVRPAYVAEHLEKARAALDNHRCADFKAQVQLILDVDAQNDKALDLQKKTCTTTKEE